MNEPQLTKRQRETAKRRAAGRCLSCGREMGLSAIVPDDLEQYVIRVTCFECGKRANESRNRRKARS